MYLSIPIDEGPVFDIGKIDFKGDLIGPRSDYYDRLTIHQGDTFNRSKVGEDINKLNDYYKDKGYAYVNVTPATNVDLEKRTVGLSFQIEKGKKVYFERINIRGNSKTRDKVIRREMKISEGELYNQTALEESEAPGHGAGLLREGRRLDRARLARTSSSTSTSRCRERPTGTFQIGAGFSSVENFIAQAQISQNNLFGRGQTLALQAQLSSLRQLFLLRFVEPYFLDTQWTFAFDLYNQSQAFGGFARNAPRRQPDLGPPAQLRDPRVPDLQARGRRGHRPASSGLRQHRRDPRAGRGPERRQPVPRRRDLVAASCRSSTTRATIACSRPTAGTTTPSSRSPTSSPGRRTSSSATAASIRHYRPLVGPFVLKLNARDRRHHQPRPPGRAHHRALPHRRHLRRARLRAPLAGPGPPGDPAGRRRPAAGPAAAGRQLQLIWNSEIEFPLFKQVGISGVVFFDAGNAYNLEDRYCSSSTRSSDISPKFDPCFRFPESLIQGLRRSVGFGIPLVLAHRAAAV